MWISFSYLPGNFALKKGGDFWWIFSGLRLLGNEARKLLENFGENSEQNSGGNSGQKFKKFGELSFCHFSDLRFSGSTWNEPCANGRQSRSLNCSGTYAMSLRTNFYARTVAKISLAIAWLSIAWFRPSKFRDHYRESTNPPFFKGGFLFWGFCLFFALNIGKKHPKQKTGVTKTGVCWLSRVH